MIFGVDITSAGLALALLGGFCLGVSKTGFPGLALVNILIIIKLFGAIESTGIILPLLILCDLIVYPLFRKSATWRDVMPLFWPTMIGVAVGYGLVAWIMQATEQPEVANQIAKPIIGAIIVVMMVLQIVRQYRTGFLKNLPDSPSFHWFSGGAIGISTAIANAAGPVYSIYALVRKMEKNHFLGVGARFFLLVNVIKVAPLVWLGLITPTTLRINLLMVPGILMGIALGRRLIQFVPQRTFEWLLYVFSAIAAIRLIFS